mgnify:FL=1
MKKLKEKDFDIEKLRKELLDCIEERYLQFKQGEVEKMREEYITILYEINQWKDYRINGRKIKAKIVGIDNIGRLLLEREKGKTKPFSLKEISFLF